MLKQLVASLDEVNEKYQSLYSEQDDGTFSLDSEISNSSSVTGLSENNKKLKSEKIKLREKLESLEQDNKEREEKLLEDEKDFVTRMEKRQTNWSSEKTAFQTENHSLVEQIKSSKLAQRVSLISAELFGENADLLQGQVQSRMRVEQDDGGKFVFQILDDNFQESNLSEKQLIEELRANPRLQPFIQGRKSSGGGSEQTNGGGGIGSESDWAKYFDRDSEEYNPSKQVELELSNKVLHDQLVEKYHLNDFSFM